MASCFVDLASINVTTSIPKFCYVDIASVQVTASAPSPNTPIQPARAHGGAWITFLTQKRAHGGSWV